MGPELLGQLSKMIRKRSDPRDWMPYYRGCVHDECWRHDGGLMRVPDPPESVGVAARGVRKRGAEWVTDVAEPTAEQVADASADIWFDYLADAGDAADSMYAVAYATMVSFTGDTNPITWSNGHDPKELELAKADTQASLPRGQFVFFGGDTAYHVSDAASLRVRVQEPFDWAFHDAQQGGYIAESARSDVRDRRIYGIPGNHDWYDNIEGFSLVFRLGSGSAGANDKSMMPIPLPELQRVQLASYVGIQLPFGWQMWGLDIDGGLDSRQQAYFESLKSERLIIATPSPAIAFGASIAKDEHRKALEALKVPIPKVPVNGAVPPGIRLDLSGDIHHYARYYPREQGETYGSVVSGLGGSFHHPSFTRATSTAERVEPVRLFPPEQESREAVADNMLRWSSTWIGSWARVVPFTLTLLLGFAATYSKGGAWLLQLVMSLLPSFSVEHVPGGPAELGIAALLLGAVLTASWGVHSSIRFGMKVFEMQFANPALAENIFDLIRNGNLQRLLAPYRSYMYCWAIGLFTIAPLVLAPLWLPPSVAPGLDLATLVIFLVLPAAGAIAAWKVAAHYLATPMKIVVALAGLVHAVAQILTCLLFARIFALSHVTMIAGVWAIACGSWALYLARPLYKSGARLHTVVLALLPLLVFVVAMGPLVWVADGQGVQTAHDYGSTRELSHLLWDLLRYVVSAGFAMPVGTTWFVWYLAVTSCLDAHNNEAGGSARITKYRQFIRFNLRADGLTGYVIAIIKSTEGTDPVANSAIRMSGKNLRFKLVDVFTLPTPPLNRLGR